MKTTNMVFVFITAMLANGCTAQTTKTLTETTARDLIRNYVRTQHLAPTISLNLGLATQQETTVDYNNYKTTGPTGALKRMIDRKYIVQTSHVVSYPKISGTFSYRVPALWMGNILRHEFDIQSVAPTALIGPNLLTITRVDSLEDKSGHVTRAEQSFRNLPGNVGAIGSSGTGQVTFDGMVFTYVEEGGKAILRAASGVDYVGGPAMEKITVTLYNYALSPEFLKLIAGSNPPSVVIGTYDIGEVTDLALSIETRAEATFAWQSTPNEVARVLLGEDAVPGKGTSRVEFAKKPDGSWFVDSVSWH